MEPMQREGGRMEPMQGQKGQLERYGALRMWARVLMVVGWLGVVTTAIGTIIWAVEVHGFWRGLGVILIGGPIAIFLATAPIAIAQSMNALADVGDTVRPV
jgi:cation transport ATPase